MGSRAFNPVSGAGHGTQSGAKTWREGQHRAVLLERAVQGDGRYQLIETFMMPKD